MNQRQRKYEDPRINSAAEELNRYRALQRDIGFLEHKVEEWREKCISIRVARLDSLRVKGGERIDSVADMVVKWAQLHDEAEQKKLEASHELWTIEVKLRKMTLMQSEVIRLYYIKGFSVEEIANILGYGERQIIRFKREAIEKYAYL